MPAEPTTVATKQLESRMLDLPRREIALFAYGNFRPGMPLWAKLEPHVDSIRSAHTPGRLYWHDAMTYPLLVPGDDGHRVSGDILVMPPRPEVCSLIVEEELLFGYEARWLRATLVDPEETMDVLAMTWPWSTNLGPEIGGGDYVPAVAHRDR